MRGEMRKKYFNMFILGLVITGILMSPILGCSKQELRQIKAFFFSNDHTAYGTEKPAGKLYFHPPYSNNYCTQCHLSSGFPGTQKASPAELALIKAKAMPYSPRLVLPVNQLCMKCHGYDYSEKTFAEGLWMHAPSAQGACTFCHCAHQSQNRHLLRSGSSRLCTERCHLEGFSMQKKVHRGSKECIECHNPHFGINSLTLKKDYREMWLTPILTWFYPY